MSQRGGETFNQTELWDLDGMNLTGKGVNKVCYSPFMVTTNGVFLDRRGRLPLEYSLCLVILQLTVILVTTRIVYFIIKPLRQPKVVAEILGGILLGPSFLGSVGPLGRILFPLRSIMILQSVSNVGIICFMFLLGVEQDVIVLRHIGRQVLIFALVSMIVPGSVGISTAYLLKGTLTTFENYYSLIFLGLTISTTAFPVLSRILGELKLLNTELGRIAMSAAMVTQMFTSGVMAITVTSMRASNPQQALSDDSTPMKSIGIGCAFFVVCFFVVRPALKWITNRNPEGETINDFHVHLILAGAMLSASISHAIGGQAMFGAFIFGLAIPNGPVEYAIMEKVEDYVNILLLPVFFMLFGFRINFGGVKFDKNAAWLIFIVLQTCIVKVLSIFLVSLLHNMPIPEGVSMGLFMNTTGFMGMIILSVGRNFNVIDEQTYAIMTVFMLLMTCITTPAVKEMCKTGKRYISYRHRTIEKAKAGTELRIQICVHTPRNVPTMINLVDASHPSKKSPICIYALHLVELSGRASALLTHTSTKPNQPAITRNQVQSENIINVFQNYAQNVENVMVQPLTAISPYSTMHEDICNLAEDKRLMLILLPFHKQQTVDGGMETINPAFRNVNKNVLANAPCSVGVLIDRGFGGSTRSSAHICFQVLVLFFGGPDDREALAYASRMIDNPGVNLTVMRFLPRDKLSNTNQGEGNLLLTDEREEQLNDQYIRDFRLKTVNDEKVVYKETYVNNGEETVTMLVSTSNNHDLCIVGRGQDASNPLMEGLTDWSECPELGPIGDLLASSDFETISVLVVQQYVGEGIHGDGMSTPDSMESSTNNNRIMRDSFDIDTSTR